MHRKKERSVCDHPANIVKVFLIVNGKIVGLGLVPVILVLLCIVECVLHAVCVCSVRECVQVQYLCGQQAGWARQQGHCSNLVLQGFSRDTEKGDSLGVAVKEKAG